MSDDERSHPRLTCIFVDESTTCFHLLRPSAARLYALQKMSILMPDIALGSPRGNSSNGIDIQSALNGNSKAK